MKRIFYMVGGIVTTLNRIGRSQGLMVVFLGGLLAGCSITAPVGRPIFESSVSIVRLEPNQRLQFPTGTGYSHPVSLSEDQFSILLTSISARQKVGLLRSFLGTPGTPRLFESAEIDHLVPALKEALGQAAPGEVITFSYERPGREGFSNVTSGTLFVQGEILRLTIANLWHPVSRQQSDVGATDRVDDVRETAQYVRSHPWISVGEQDFAIFLDDPKYQMESRRGELFGYPERTLSIAYRPFLASNPDKARRVEEVKHSAQQEAFGKNEAQVIADLQRRIAELEESKATLRSKLNRIEASSETTPAPVEGNADGLRDTNQRLLDAIRSLEPRLATLEKEVRDGARERRMSEPSRQ